MRISWHPEAHDDLRDAAKWYESREPGLGDKFTDAVAQAIDRIDLFGETFAKIDQQDQVRVCPVIRFPYHINFITIGDDEARILCVKHNRRHPNYGADRR